MQTRPTPDAQDRLPIVIATIMRPEGDTGVQTHFREFRDQLAERGVETELITAFSAPAIVRYPLFGPRKLLQPLNGSLALWWYYKWHYELLLRALRERLRDGEPTVIYAQSPAAAEAAMEARRSVRQRIVLAVHYGESDSRNWILRGEIPTGGWMDRYIRAREQRTIPLVDGIVAVSEDNHRELIEEVPAAAAVPHRVVPNFLKSPPHSEATPTRDVITIGTLETRKNQRYIVDVIAEARALGRDVTATVVGDGEDRGDLETLADERGVADLIDFRGFVPDGARLIPDHRLYVHSAVYESFCIAAAEGLSYGRPVIAAPVGGLPEVFDDNVEGRFWPLDSPQRGAEILLDVLNDSDAYDRMSAAARRRFETSFDADVVVPRLYEFLQEIGARGLA